ncbi:hypothetical protein MalM25_19240 [Planctomycetes bacterium MalM25]|nr:hypothetical protein MalM25_19240 [Planctomycetes bacterium MalM25]
MTLRIFAPLIAGLLLGTATEAKQGGQPVFTDTFDGGSLDRWEVLDPATWRGNADGTVEITDRPSEYKPPHRSPGHVALAKGVKLEGGCRIEFRVKSTKDTGPHRDCCVFFGWQDPAHFYYVHLGAKPDPHSGQIMVVDGAPRLALTENTKPTPWDDDWHTVRLDHDPESGRVAIYFDDMEKPFMEVNDKTFGGGRVGIGSFDDLNAFDEVRVYDTE